MTPKYNTARGIIAGELLRDTHRFKKEKNETTRTFAVKRENSILKISAIP
jgi:hypothetical protein